MNLAQLYIIREKNHLRLFRFIAVNYFFFLPVCNNVIIDVVPFLSTQIHTDTHTHAYI